MDEHLNACVDCRTRFNMCRAMHTLLGDKTASDPPNEWIREGVSLFDPKLFDQSPDYVFAMLTADSLIGTDPELRSTVIQERQLSFESTGYMVSVLIETSNSVLKGVVGQLSRKGAELPAGELKGVPAELRVNGEVYRTEMTEFGEFLFRVNENLDGNPIELRFAIKEEPCLALLIPC
ncbi:MAG TPA: hypothetical protein VE422_25930 [Terriglobia bacterium]|nr:hypothetical protein [Terriglobia bacterium]